jgi:hypothetical protein
MRGLLPNPLYLSYSLVIVSSSSVLLCDRSVRTKAAHIVTGQSPAV